MVDNGAKVFVDQAYQQCGEELYRLYNQPMSKTLFGRQMRQVFEHVKNLNPGRPHSNYYPGLRLLRRTELARVPTTVSNKKGNNMSRMCHPTSINCEVREETCRVHQRSTGKADANNTTNVDLTAKRISPVALQEVCIDHHEEPFLQSATEKGASPSEPAIQLSLHTCASEQCNEDKMKTSRAIQTSNPRSMDAKNLSHIVRTEQKRLHIAREQLTQLNREAAKSRKERHTSIQIPQSMYIDRQLLERRKQIGSGSYGACYFGKFRGTPVVLKKIKERTDTRRRGREDALNTLLKEAKVMLQLPSHRSLPVLFGVCKESLTLVVQFYAADNHRNVVTLSRAFKKIVNSIDWRKLFLDLAHGLQAIHRCSLVHNDLHGKYIIYLYIYIYICIYFVYSG